MISAGTLRPDIVVLAAGASTRLGRNKSLVRIRGKTVLRIQLERLSPFSRGKVSVVVPPRSAAGREARRHGGRCIVNPSPERGMSSSVRCALKHLRRSEAVLILPVDLIQLNAPDLERMLESWRGNRRKLIARRLGMRGVAPVVLPKRLFRLSATLAGDVGFRDLIAGLPPREKILVAMPSAALDIDTPQDLTAARRRFVAAR